MIGCGQRFACDCHSHCICPLGWLSPCLCANRFSTVDLECVRHQRRVSARSSPIHHMLSALHFNDPLGDGQSQAGGVIASSTVRTPETAWRGRRSHRWAVRMLLHIRIRLALSTRKRLASHRPAEQKDVVSPAFAASCSSTGMT